ncbi:flagellin [Rhizobium sp. SSA_523]|uniref:flagellin N-terminal helical domain-containing protein n=1 Tax=Rhizobium sp. SSA_523 TaxID=2952477 RepID=UPI002090F18F|nr:flagellin [Rhizobium sp. SSA_523]MCO5731106.1 flagellin [Rhizobium sp. SSA_523]WKC25837.1 flagellin [Rhizobium sp. SSA_523]
MTSLVTNTAAIAALASLRMLQASLDETQDKVSSGLRVQVAADNAAFWSIGTTMRSDRKALGAVADAMDIGFATVDIAYAGMKATVGLLDDIKTKLVAASQQGVDRDKVQKEIGQLQVQLQSVIESASFSGQNWLKASGTSADLLSTAIVSGFTRNRQGAVELQRFDVDLSKTVLLNKSGGGLLQFGDAAFDTFGGFVEAYNRGGFFANGSFTGPFKVSAGDSLSFRMGGPTLPLITVTIDRNLVDSVLGSNAKGTIFGVSDMAAIVNRAILNAGGSMDDAKVYVADARAFTNGSASGLYDTFQPIQIVNSGVNAKVSVLDMTIAGSRGSLATQIGQVDSMIKSTTIAAADLGAIQSRLKQQSEFTASLIDAIGTGIGTLVDADMNESVTRLKALQIQQQLAVQALSIANSANPALIQLFQ